MSNSSCRLGVRFVLDTHLIDDPSVAMQHLRELDRDGWIQLLRTDVMDTELEQRTDPAHRAQLLTLSGEYVELLGPAVWGHSRWDHTVWAGPEDELLLDDVWSVLSPHRVRSDPSARQRVRDAMNVVTTIRYGERFVTRDNGIVQHAATLSDRFGLEVFTPERASAFVGRLRGRYDARRGPP